MIEYYLDSSQVETTELGGPTIITYVWTDVEALNAALTALVLRREANEPGIRTTNAGGWHSRKDLSLWSDACVTDLVGRMRAMGSTVLEHAGIHAPITGKDLDIQAWANVNRRGHFNKYHHHLRNNNIWSGVYYVSMGVVSGEAVAPLLFVDPHAPRWDMAHSAMELPMHQITPQSGLMVVFPSSLWHHVPPHAGKKERISIAFNFRHPKLSTLHYAAIADPAVSRV